MAWYGCVICRRWQTRGRTGAIFTQAVIRVSHILRHFVERRHDYTGRSLMDHVAGSGNAVKPALGDVEVQSCRLRINVDQSVFITCDDYDGNLQFADSSRKRNASGIISADSAADARI